MRLLLIILFCSLYCTLPAQDLNNLAAQYFGNGEYEKAVVYYQKLLENDERSEFYLGRYIDCLFNLEQYAEAEKTLKRQLKKYPENVLLYVTYGTLYELQEKPEDAKAQYNKAVEKMSSDYASVSRLASEFVRKNKYEYAIAAFERGGRLLNDPQRFAFNLGELYRRKGDAAKMVTNYLDALAVDPGKLPTVQTLLARYLAAEEYTELQTQVYARLQKEDNPDFIELLAWSFVQRKDYKSALRQYRALDKRLGEAGQRVMKLADDAAKSKDYDTAIAGYEYIINEKGQGTPFFFEAKREVMTCRRLKITEGFNYTAADLRTLEAEYDNFLKQYGLGKVTADIVLEMAELEALYINDLPRAIKLLDALRQAPNVDRNTAARTKINLADYYLMTGDIWEGTLLYSQVDKEFKEEQIGQEARYKNARLAYFNGDFQWARAQFDALKASTAKLISNDAIDLSVFIMDNLNLDTTSTAISLYAGAELLVFQNRFPEAFLKLDTLRRDFPEHSLQDDILYLEAQIHEKKREYEKAAALYQQVFEKFPQDIRADNALYALAQLYDFKIIDPEKAKTLYEKIFNDYSGSVFAVEARKRYRVLRGDKVQ